MSLVHTPRLQVTLAHTARSLPARPRPAAALPQTCLKLADGEGLATAVPRVGAVARADTSCNPALGGRGAVGRGVWNCSMLVPGVRVPDLLTPVTVTLYCRAERNALRL